MNSEYVLMLLLIHYKLEWKNIAYNKADLNVAYTL